MANKVPKTGSPEALTLLLILIAGFLLRLLLARFESEVGVDSVHYVLMGDNIAKGVSFDTWNTTGGRWVLPPTFPLLIALFRSMGVPLEWSGHLASVFSGTFLLCAIYLVTKRLFGRQTATIALIISTFYPVLVDYSVVILTEDLFAAFVLMTMLFMLKAFDVKGKPIDAFWSGIYLALAFLTKTFGIFLLPFLFLSYLFGKGGRSSSKSVTQAILSLVGFLILAVPYWVVLHNYTGKWVIDGKGQGQASRIYASDLSEERVDPRYSGELTPDGSDFLINANPDVETGPSIPFSKLASTYIRKYIQKLVRIYQDFPFTPTYPNNVQILYLFPAMLLGLGLFSGKGKWLERHSDRFLLYWLIPFIFVIPLVFVEVRYYIAVVPLLIPFMARGIEDVAGWLTERFSGKVKLLTPPKIDPAIAIVLVVFILLTLPKLTYKLTHQSDPMVSYNPREAAADWLIDNGYHPDRIMEYAHSVSFYSGAQSILIPSGDLGDVIRIARKYNCELLSLDEFYVLRAHRRPEIEFLFDLNQPTPRELELIYSDSKYDGLHHVIYRIRTPEEIENLAPSETW